MPSVVSFRFFGVSCILWRSFGGVVLLKLMEELANDGLGMEDGGENEEKGEGASAVGGTGIRASMGGGAFLCSVPPSGNGPMTKRFIKEVSREYECGCIGCVTRGVPAGFSVFQARIELIFWLCFL